jgi:hypothetical protein
MKRCRSSLNIDVARLLLDKLLDPEFSILPKRFLCPNIKRFGAYTVVFCPSATTLKGHSHRFSRNFLIFYNA